MSKQFFYSLFIVGFLFLVSVSCTGGEIGVDIVTPQITAEAFEAPGESVQNGMNETNTLEPAPTVEITEPTQTPTRIVPTITSTPIIVSTTLTSSSEQSFPLPEIVLNLAPSPNPLVTCADTENLGQLLFSQFPYDSVELVMSNSTIAYNHPVWAPDGDSLAFVSTEIADFTESFQENGIWRFYEDSVSARLDDGTQREISIPFTRAEFLSAENSSCTVTEGITSVVGWSFDSKWIAFIYQTVDSTNRTVSSLYISNIDSQETMLVTEKVSYASWHPNQNKIIAATYGEKPAIEIISINNFSIEPVPLSPEFPAQLGFGQITWSTNNQKIFVIVSDISFFNAPSALWSYDSHNSEWDIVLDLAGQSGIQLASIGGSLLLCTREDGQNIIQIVDQATGQLSEVNNNVEGMGCKTNYFSDTVGREFISFNNIVDRKSLWISSLSQQNPLLEKVIDGNFEQLKNLEIASYDWRPIPSDQ